MQSIRDFRLRLCKEDIERGISNYCSSREECRDPDAFRVDSVRHIIINEKRKNNTEWLEITPKFLDKIFPSEALMVIVKAVESHNLRIDVGSYVNNPYLIISHRDGEAIDQL
jgi:hypothetical protein